MDGPNMEQLLRNGQLTWKTSETHRETLARYYAFYKGSAEEQLIASLYPGFIESLSQKVEVQEPKEEVVEPVAEIVSVEESSESPIIEGLVEDVVVKPKKGKKSKSSQS